MRAIEQIQRTDLRRRRAQALTYRLMEVLKKYVPREDHNALRDATHDALETLAREGVELITDYERQQCGLAPRDELGWTQEEIVAYEARRLEMMLAPLPPMLVLKDDGMVKRKLGYEEKDENT